MKTKTEIERKWLLNDLPFEIEEQLCLKYPSFIISQYYLKDDTRLRISVSTTPENVNIPEELEIGFISNEKIFSIEYIKKIKQPSSSNVLINVEENLISINNIEIENFTLVDIFDTITKLRNELFIKSDIVKIRVYLNNNWVLDKIKTKNNTNLYILEKEYDSIEESTENTIFPENLNEFVVKEVTNDPSFSNFYLSTIN